MKPSRVLLAGTILLCTTLLCTMAGTALAQDDPKIETFRPVTAAEAAITLLPATPEGAAGELQYAARCSTTRMRTAVVALRWRPTERTGGDERIDITKFRDGFELDRYETTGRLPRGQDAAGLEGPEPGINYYWRVLTEAAHGWVPSAVERFEVPICPWDEADPDAEGYPPVGAGGTTAASESGAPAGGDR